MIESGLISSWISNLVPNSSNCDTKAKILSSHERPLVQLTLVDMERFFLIIIVGLITSVIGLLAEIIRAKLDRNKVQNKGASRARERSSHDTLIQFPTPSTAPQPAPAQRAVDQWLTLQLDAIEQEKSDYEKGHEDSHL